MHQSPAKSNSESNLRHNTSSAQSPPPASFVSTRAKRTRSDDLHVDFSKFKDEMKDMFASWMTQQTKETTKISSSLKTIEEATNFLSSQFEELKIRVIETEKDRQKDKEHIILLENKIEDLEKSQRKCSLELKNVPRIEKETKTCLLNMVTQLASTLKIDIKHSDIKDIYRTSSKLQNRPIIVELLTYTQKTNILSTAKKYNMQNKNNKLNSSHLGLKCPNTPIYLCDHLTQKGNRLFYLARELTRAKKYKFCWTSLGDVLVRKDETSPIIKIISESQIINLSERDVNT